MFQSAWKFASSLGAVAGALSLVTLAKEGFDLGIAASFRRILEWYQLVISFLFDWATPWLDNWLTNIEFFLRLDLHLFPHWKHVFVLVELYFAADSRRDFAKGNWRFGLVMAVLGFIIALITSVIAGTVSFADHELHIEAIVSPIAGLVFYELARGILLPNFYKDVAPAIAHRYIIEVLLPTLLIGIGVLAVGGQIESSKVLGNPSLILLGLFVLLLPIYWLARGVVVGSARRMQLGGRWADYVYREMGVRMALMMLASILGAVIFLLLNAGLNSVGL